jgi:hypothetical protein
MSRAWVITWDWANEAASKRDKVIGLLPPDTPVEEVARHLERTYALASYNLGEWASFIANVADGMPNPYRAEVRHYRDPESGAYVTVGHNPHLEAYLADDVQVSTETDDGVETVTWSYTAPNGTRQQEAYTRTKKGAISLEDAWDRTKSEYKRFTD